MANKEKEHRLVDFDGTLAVHKTEDGMSELGAPVPKMLEQVKAWLTKGEKVKIFTARVNPKSHNQGEAAADAQRKAIQAWCKKWIGSALEVVCDKDHLAKEIWDDKAVRVEKNRGERTK